MKDLILYQGKYGATRQYAKWLTEELNLQALPAGSYDAATIDPSALLILGSSVYIGKLQIAAWVKKFRHELQHRHMILFVVSGTPAGKTDKLNGYVSASLPTEIIERCAIFFLPGRLRYHELSWKDKFMLRVGAFFAVSKAEKQQMLAGYDDVRKEHLKPLITFAKDLLNTREAAEITKASVAVNP